jgi:hypothetical protein
MKNLFNCWELSKRQSATKLFIKEFLWKSKLVCFTPTLRIAIGLMIRVKFTIKILAIKLV